MSGAVYPSVDSVSRFLRFFKVGDTRVMRRSEAPLIGSADQWCFRIRCPSRGGRPGAVTRSLSGSGPVVRRVAVAPAGERR